MTAHLRCELCQENLGREGDYTFLLMVEHGSIAEMFDPGDSGGSGIVHTECGLGHGWLVS